MDFENEMNLLDLYEERFNDFQDNFFLDSNLEGSLNCVNFILGKLENELKRINEFDFTSEELFDYRQGLAETHKIYTFLKNNFIDYSKFKKAKSSYYKIEIK